MLSLLIVFFLNLKESRFSLETYPANGGFFPSWSVNFIYVKSFASLIFRQFRLLGAATRTTLRMLKVLPTFLQMCCHCCCVIATLKSVELSTKQPVFPYPRVAACSITSATLHPSHPMENRDGFLVTSDYFCAVNSRECCRNGL